jgi:hypothetical protein
MTPEQQAADDALFAHHEHLREVEWAFEDASRVVEARVRERKPVTEAGMVAVPPEKQREYRLNLSSRGVEVYTTLEALAPWARDRIYTQHDAPSIVAFTDEQIYELVEVWRKERRFRVDILSLLRSQSWGSERANYQQIIAACTNLGMRTTGVDIPEGEPAGFSLTPYNREDLRRRWVSPFEGEGFDPSHRKEIVEALLELVDPDTGLPSKV